MVSPEKESKAETETNQELKSAVLTAMSAALETPTSRERGRIADRCRRVTRRRAVVLALPILAHVGHR